MSPLKQIGRTYTSIVNLMNRGGSLNSKRGQLLADRYNDLKSELTHGGRELWEAHCRGINACPTHNGYDLFA
jgi:hypothetical protein